MSDSRKVLRFGSFIYLSPSVVLWHYLLFFFLKLTLYCLHNVLIISLKSWQHLTENKEKFLLIKLCAGQQDQNFRVRRYLKDLVVYLGIDNL